MALIKAGTAQGFARLPALRQIGLMIGLAASVALGVAVVLWSQKPSYGLLYGSLSAKDSSQVVQALQQSNIPYQIDAGSGAVMVPVDKVHEARLKLAGEGLPKGVGVGFELLEKEQELGTSQFVEQARYQHALEIELARSISSIDNVRAARVHLAIPKRTVFIRKQDKPSASVVVDLYAGRQLERGQVAAIVHLVASSVPNLMPDKVTVIDQAGDLLTNDASDRGMALTSNQFEFTRRMEDMYARRIENLISPIVGPGRVRAQVVADLDFTSVEKTSESYDPTRPSLRSEQLVEEHSSSADGVGGVPGALSNQPPGAGTTVAPRAAPKPPTTQRGGKNQASAANPPAPAPTPSQPQGSSTKRVVRNFELDKTISHTRSPAGNIRKLSVAVLVDDRQSVNDAGQVERKPLDAKELAQITALVKDTVGFNAARGDSVNVINSAFEVPPTPEALPEPPMWQQPWAKDIMKQALGGLVVLLLVFAVLRPVLRGLAEKGLAAPPAQLAGAELAQDRVTLDGQRSAGQLPGPGGYDEKLGVARSMASQDPRRVAQVVKNWVANDG